MKYIDNKLSANIIRLEDANNNYMSEDVEGALEEIDSKIKTIKANGYDDTQIKQDINNIKNEIGTEELTTTDQSIKGAVNEINSQIKDIKNVYAKKEEIGEPTQEQVNTWLDLHPEATTTIQDGSIEPKKTTFFNVKVNLATLVDKYKNKTIGVVNGLIAIKDTDDSNYYLTDFIDISNIPTGKMVIVRGLSGGKFLRYDSDKNLISGAKDNNRVYYKEENACFIKVTNTFDSDIETEVYALGENAEDYFKDDYDKYKGMLDNDDNIFNYEKAVFGYWFNGTTLSHAFSPTNMFIYGYIDISGKDEIYLIHNSVIYKSFNIGFYDSNYNLIKVVSNKKYYSIAEDSDLTNAKYIIIGSTNNYDSRNKEQLKDVVVSFKEPIGTPKQKMINEDFIDERKFIKNGWYGQVCDSLGDSLTEFGYFQKDIENKLGLLKFDNHGVGGSTMLGTKKSSMNNDARINLLNPDAKLITIMAGTNDYAAIFNAKTNDIGEISIDNTDISTFVGAYNVAIKKIYDKYNNDVQIIIMTSLFNMQHNESDFIKIIDATIEIAKMWNIKYIDLHRECGLNVYNSSKWWSEDDKVHPTKECYTKKISPLICANIKNIEPII